MTSLARDADRTIALDQVLIACAVVLTAVLFLPAALDPVNVVKLTVLLLLVIGLVVSVTVRAVRHRVVHVPAGAAAAVAAALGIAFTVSAAVAPVTTTAILGAYGRNSGWLAYVAALVLFLVALRVYVGQNARVLVGGVVAAALFSAVYGLLQKAGLDAIPWANPFNPIIAALGNPNFASGYLGIGASVAAGGALWRGWGPPWRILCGVTAFLCLFAASLSASVQGPIAAAAGLTVVALAWILDLDRKRRQVGLAALAFAAALGLGALLAGALASAGPAVAIFTDNGSLARTYYWRAALEMLSDRPLLGRGLDQYGNFWRTARPQESVAFLGGPSYSDAAHSVPLQMLAQGGLLLGLTYVAFIAVTAAALAVGLVRLRGPERMLLAAVGAGWLAYQVQSFVSIDQVPLIVLHFSLAGGVIAAAGRSRLREIRLPGAPPPVTVRPNDTKAKRRVAARVPQRRQPTGADVAVLAGVGLLALVAAWQAVVPLRANIAAKSGDRFLSAGDGDAALAAYEHAISLVPGQSFYAIKKGALFDRVEQPTLARQAYEQAYRVDPYEVNALKAAAERAETAGDLNQARKLFRRAAALDPYNQETIVAAATFELRHSGAEAARDILLAASERLPGAASVWATLGDAHAVLGQEAEARAAYKRALTLEPDQSVAVQGLDKLPAATP